jgi:hypothetical protein
MSTPPEPIAGPNRRLWWWLLLGAGGVAVLVWTVRQLELQPADIREGFASVGWWFGAILLLSLVRFYLRARAWIALTGARLPTGAAVAATISGDALGNLTPLGLVASEPAKTWYLRGHADPAATLPALVAENFFYSVSVAIYIVVAAAAMFLFFDLTPAVRLAGQISLGVMALVLCGAAWMAVSKPTLVSSLVSRLPGRRVSGLARQLRQFEQQTYAAAAQGGHPLGTVAVCEVGFHLVSLLECWLTFWLLAGVLSPLPALVFDGFNRIVNVLFKHLPLRVGVEEGGTALVAGAIGLIPHDGFMLGIVRKVRMIVWAGVGLVLWAQQTRRSGLALRGD